MTFRLRGDSRRLFAHEINRWNKMADQHARGELRKIPAPTVKSFDPSSRVALVKNTSGADRSAFECLSVDGLSYDLDLAGTSDVIFELITADPDKAPAILIEPVANGAIGRAILDGLAIAKVGGGSGLTGTPDATNHRITPGSGSIKLLSAPHATNVTLLPVVLNAGSAQSGITGAIGFIGRDLANAVKWTNGAGVTGYTDFTTYASTYAATYGSNIGLTDLGITVVPSTLFGAPANAEMLNFANVGRYLLTIALQLGANGTGDPLSCELNVSSTGGLISSGYTRGLSIGGTASLTGYEVWLQDTRLIETTSTNVKVYVSVAAAHGLADPLATGSMTITKV